MATTNIMSLFISILAFTVPFSNHVKADDALIRSLCQNADVPMTCLQCVSQSSEAKDADQVGIASIVVDCLTTNMATVKANISTLASTEVNKTLKESYQNCDKDSLPSSETALVGVNPELKKGAYDDALGSLVGALANQTTCHKDLLQYSEDVVPSDVLFRMEVFKQLAIAAMRIVERF